MSWSTWAQIASLIVISGVMIGTIINSAITQWAKYKRGTMM